MFDLRIESMEGIGPGPKDLLRSVGPEWMAEIAIITRTGIFFREDDELLTPLDLITGKI
jgi:hypothetical protein